MNCKKWLLLAAALIVCGQLSVVSCYAQRGLYFSKKAYTPAPLPRFDSIRHLLPEPVLDEHPEWVALYYKAWQIAFSRLQSPPEGSPLVSSWIDEGLSPQIFQWDTHFMAMFGRYAFHIFPFIASHDNFYARQHPDGMICRVINEADGADHVWGLGKNYARTINPPLFSWAEIEYYKFSGDRQRLAQVLLPIEKYVSWVEAHRRATGTVHQLYWSNGQASGMDNTPRDEGRTQFDYNVHSATDQMGWVDMSAQIKMCYDNLALICTTLGLTDRAAAYTNRADSIGRRINRYLWDDTSGLYYDVTPDAQRTRWITVATFWPILANVASAAQTRRLVEAITNRDLFWRRMPLPSLAANQPGYDKAGCYWRGGVWAPTTYMTVRGLAAHGYEDLAAQIAERNLTAMASVYRATGTIWEVYAPDIYMPATTASGYEMCEPNFVGWSGLVPISMLIENVLGIEADGAARTLTWHLRRTSRHGIRHLRFGAITTSLIADGNTITVESDGEYTLVVNGRAHRVGKGTFRFAK